MGWDWEGGGVLGTWLGVGLRLGGRRGSGDVARGWAETGREEGFWGRAGDISLILRTKYKVRTELLYKANLIGYRSIGVII